VLEDFFSDVEEVKEFEKRVAKLKKVVYLGTQPLDLKQSEIAYFCQQDSRLERAPKGQSFEFYQLKFVRNDLAVVIVHESLLQK
jgi:hypothetical protein